MYPIYKTIDTYAYIHTHIDTLTYVYIHACTHAYTCIHVYTHMYVCVCAKSCPILCDPMDWSLPGSSVHGIFQARRPEWVAIFSSRGIFPSQGLNLHLLCLLHWQMGSLLLHHTCIYIHIYIELQGFIVIPKWMPFAMQWIVTEACYVQGVIQGPVLF